MWVDSMWLAIAIITASLIHTGGSANCKLHNILLQGGGNTDLAGYNTSSGISLVEFCCNGCFETDGYIAFLTADNFCCLYQDVDSVELDNDYIGGFCLPEDTRCQAVRLNNTSLTGESSLVFGGSADHCLYHCDQNDTCIGADFDHTTLDLGDQMVCRLFTTLHGKSDTAEHMAFVCNTNQTEWPRCDPVNVYNSSLIGQYEEVLAPSIELCCKACDENATCLASGFNEIDYTCHLYTEITTIVDESNHIASVCSENLTVVNDGNITQYNNSGVIDQHRRSAFSLDITTCQLRCQSYNECCAFEYNQALYQCSIIIGTAILTSQENSITGSFNQCLCDCKTIRFTNSSIEGAMVEAENVSSIGGCCGACDDMGESCAAFVFNDQSSTCHLYAKIYALIPNTSNSSYVCDRGISSDGCVSGMNYPSTQLEGSPERWLALDLEECCALCEEMNCSAFSYDAIDLSCSWFNSTNLESWTSGSPNVTSWIMPQYFPSNQSAWLCEQVRFNNTSFTGTDIWRSLTLTLNQCCTLCDEQSDCVAFSFSTDSALCVLMSNITGKQDDDEFDSIYCLPNITVVNNGSFMITPDVALSGEEISSSFEVTMEICELKCRSISSCCCLNYINDTTCVLFSEVTQVSTQNGSIAARYSTECTWMTFNSSRFVGTNLNTVPMTTPELCLDLCDLYGTDKCAGISFDPSKDDCILYSKLKKKKVPTATLR